LKESKVLLIESRLVRPKAGTADTIEAAEQA
jgi:hypothetical protein